MKPDTPESDSQLELKKSARRRLIGAAFFVILAAAVLPLIMDTSPPPQLNDFRIVTAEERNGTAPVAPPVPVTPAEQAPAPSATPEPQTDTKPVDAVPVKSTESTPAAPAVVATPAAEPAKAEPKPEAVKPVEKPADKKDTKDAKDQTGQYYIQVGVFADADNVKQVRAKLKAQGINSWTEEATGNLAGKTRVKAGPFPSKDAADKALAKITKAGLNGMIAKK